MRTLWCFDWSEHDAHEYEAMIDREREVINCPGYTNRSAISERIAPESTPDQAGTTGTEDHENGSN